MTAGVCWRCKLAKDPAWTYCPGCGARLIDTRTPAPPNPGIDMAFLYDLYSFGWYNHHVGAVALYDAAASVDRFYGSDIHEYYHLEVEPPRAQQMLRTKIFAEHMALLEAVGVVCLAIAKRRQQSLMWTYLNTEPQEVTDFYNRVLSYGKAPSLQRLLMLPRISDVNKAVASRAGTHIASLPDAEAHELPEHVNYDYTAHSENIVLMARSYRQNDGANVRIYNKIKHVFSIVEGRGWLNPPPEPERVAIAMDTAGTVARLSMSQADVDNEIVNTRLAMMTGAELMALCLSLHLLGVLW